MFEVVRVCSFLCCICVYKVVFFPRKDWSQMRHFIQTQGNLMLRLLMPLTSFGFCCAIYYRDVQMQINCKDLTNVYLVVGLRN